MAFPAMRRGGMRCPRALVVPYACGVARFFVTQQIVRYFEVVADSGEHANKIVFDRYGGDPEVEFPVASVRTEKYEISAVLMSESQRAEQL